MVSQSHSTRVPHGCNSAVEWIPNTDFGWHNTIITAIVGMRNSFTQWEFGGIRGGRFARDCR